jgi:hypothetical protein
VYLWQAIAYVEQRMAEDARAVGTERMMTARAAVYGTVALPPDSVPLPETRRPRSHHLGRFFGGIFHDFYNTFRFTGYIAEVFYQPLVRALDRAGIKEPKNFEPWIIKPDWRSPARTVMNAIEAVAFSVIGAIAFARDMRKFRYEVGDMVAAESGGSVPHGLWETFRRSNETQNPFMRTERTRFRNLYLIRALQPFTFLYGIKAAITTTVFEIVAERAAYFEKNSYDMLRKLMRERDANQIGTWSRDLIVTRLIDAIQMNRTEHEAPPITMKDTESYFPLLGQLADRLLERKWHMSEMLYVLGQIVREPANLAKAQKVYDDVEAYGLKGIAAMKKTGTWKESPSPAGRQSVVTGLQEDKTTSFQHVISSGRTAKDIVQAGQKPLFAEADAGSTALGF